MRPEILSLVALVSPLARADDSTEEPGEASGEELVVEEKRPETAATERTLDRTEIEAMPSRSADDLLRAMPGLHLSAHGGHGKAYQYFLRGFDAVHGSDIAVSLEGVPLNEVSNVHGHGYLDLHFIPPILVRGLELHPGTWRAEAGDFAVAGSADYKLGLEEGGGLLQVGGGTDTSGAATVAWRPKKADSGTFLVADLSLGEGVGDARAWRQLRAGAGWEGALGLVQARTFLLAYDGEFESPGVLREDDLAAGEVGFYDAYPGSGGGTSRRALGVAQASGGGARFGWQGTLYSGLRAFELRQNFTGWYGDPEHGDGTLQIHQAWTSGMLLRAAWLTTDDLTLKGGLDARIDVFEQSEHGLTMEDEIWEDRYAATGVQTDLGAWVGGSWSPSPNLRIDPGLRAELFLVRNAPTLDDGEVVEDPGEGLAWAPALAPKLSTALFPEGKVTGFLALGRGFRSPDAAGTEPGEVAPVSFSDSGELGLRARPHETLELRAAGFGTLISDEIVFDHAAARFLATGRTRRVGLDTGASWRPTHHLLVDGELTWSDGVYVETGEPIPYAPRLLGALGLSTANLPIGPVALTGGLRGWALGPRPLPGGFSSGTSAVLDLTAHADWRAWTLSLDVDNVLGSEWRDGEFLFPSRWDLSDPESELPVRHFTAGAPRVLRLALGRRFG